MGHHDAPNFEADAPAARPAARLTAAVLDPEAGGLVPPLHYFEPFVGHLKAGPASCSCRPRIRFRSALPAASCQHRALGCRPAACLQAVLQLRPMLGQCHQADAHSAFAYMPGSTGISPCCRIRDTPRAMTFLAAATISAR